MILSIKEQADVFLYIFLAGAAAGMFYDVIRIIRVNIKHNAWTVNVEDIAYWLIVTVLVFLFMLNKNNADIRLFAIIGFYLGMALYNLILSRLFMKIMSIFMKILKTVIKTAVQIILTPLRLIWLVIGKPVKKMTGTAKGYLKKGLHLTKVYAKINKRRIADQMRFIRHRKE